MLSTVCSIAPNTGLSPIGHVNSQHDLVVTLLLATRHPQHDQWEVRTELLALDRKIRPSKTDFPNRAQIELTELAGGWVSVSRPVITSKASGQNSLKNVQLKRKVRLRLYEFEQIRCARCVVFELRHGRRPH
jgi:hypothetical protein